MSDLQMFCAADGAKRLRKPFSRGAYSWATDGKIMARVPRRDDIPEVEDSPNAEGVWPKDIAPEFVALQPIEIPAADRVRCDVCDGRGREHDCPDCACECAECSGIGELEEEMAIGVGDWAMKSKYARILMALPGIKIAPPTSEMMQFQFDGGDGLLMLLRAWHSLPVAGRFDLGTTP